MNITFLSNVSILGVTGSTHPPQSFFELNFSNFLLEFKSKTFIPDSYTLIFRTCDYILDDLILNTVEIFHISLPILISFNPINEANTIDSFLMCLFLNNNVLPTGSNNAQLSRLKPNNKFIGIILFM